MTAVRSEEYEVALQKIRVMMQRDPENVTLYWFAAGIAERLGRQEQAVRYLQRVRMNSTIYYRPALKKLALLHYTLGQYSRCEAMLNALEGNEFADRPWIENFRSLLAYQSLTLTD